ncbi:MAG TPA: RIP metalloprotease, partial [Gemmataceae bacterium]|nr:RIP metalloprotease [Gemmataceae bacterium]
ADLLPKRYASADFTGPVRPHSAAARATPSPFEFDDKIVATTDPDQSGTDAYDPARTKELPDDPRFPNHGRRDFFELWRRFQLLAGKNMIVVVERGDGKDVTKVQITLPPTFYQTLGVRMQMGHITGIRDGSPAAKAGVLPTRKNDNDSLLRGDLIQKAEVTEPDGSVTRWDDKNLDPERLPFELRQWADRLRKKDVPQPWKVALTVRRHEDIGHPQQFEPKTLELTWDDDWRFDRMLPMNPSSPQAIAELGLAYQIKTIVADVVPGFETKDGLHAGDAVREIRTFMLDAKSEPKPVKLKEEGEQWAQIAAWMQLTPGIDKIVLKVWRDQKLVDVTVQPALDRTWPTTDNGLVFMPDMRRQKAATTMEAVSLGFSDTWDNMTQVFHNLRGMIMGTISPDNLGGPVTIARVAYRFAGMDFWEFVFFLGLISVNLAVINFLPIPVLDGGHMVFLVYEKLRGKPASEGVRIGATYAGLALILCLMVFVLYLDISRLL